VWWGLAAGLLVVAILLLGRWSARDRLELLPPDAHAVRSLGNG